MKLEKLFQYKVHQRANSNNGENIECKK